jgi:hypothetical protein
MSALLKLEELFMFLAAIVLFSFTPYKWWLFPALILLPDVGMFGYLVNDKIGAYTYNLFHHKAIAIIIFLTGFYADINFFQLVGIIIFAHASMDRVFGYGLKYFTGFKYTHLGIIGKDEKSI